jgi:hypothetical protein
MGNLANVSVVVNLSPADIATAKADIFNQCALCSTWQHLRPNPSLTINELHKTHYMKSNLIEAVDALRGLAFVSMAVFHGALQGLT